MAKTKKKKDKELTDEQQVEKLINEHLKRFKGKLTKDEMEMQRDALKQVFIEGKAPRHAMGISPDMMNLLYTFGFNSYNAGQYADAKQSFEMLNFLEPLSPKYLMGLAATHHKLKEYEKAVELYFTLVLVDEESPVPYFHIADCYEQLDNPGGVLLGLGGAISRCGMDQRFAKLKGRCYTMMKKCKQEMGIEEPEISGTEEVVEAAEGVEAGETKEPSADTGIFGQLKDEAEKGLEAA